MVMMIHENCHHRGRWATHFVIMPLGVSGMFCVEGFEKLEICLLFVDAGVTGSDCTMAAAVWKVLKGRTEVWALAFQPAFLGSSKLERILLFYQFPKSFKCGRFSRLTDILN